MIKHSLQTVFEIVLSSKTSLGIWMAVMKKKSEEPQAHANNLTTRKEPPIKKAAPITESKRIPCQSQTPSPSSEYSFLKIENFGVVTEPDILSQIFCCASPGPLGIQGLATCGG